LRCIRRHHRATAHLPEQAAVGRLELAGLEQFSVCRGRSHRREEICDRRRAWVRAGV
jgi:hypothetical protein